jgi:hypothetical protein
MTQPAGRAPRRLPLGQSSSGHGSKASDLAALSERAARLGHRLESIATVRPLPAPAAEPRRMAAGHQPALAPPAPAVTPPGPSTPRRGPVPPAATAVAAQTPAPPATPATRGRDAAPPAPIQLQSTSRDRLARLAAFGGGLALAGGLLFSAPITATLGGTALAVGGAYSLYRHRQQRAADQRSRQLDEHEHAIYERLNSARDTGERRDLLNRLDRLQQAHTAHIDHLHRNNLDLWTADRLSSKQRSRLNESWNELRHGTGLIRTPGETGNEQSNRELRAMHARLLSRPHGRRLLYELLDKEGPATGTSVRILPREPITSEERRTARATRSRLEVLDPQLESLHGELTAAMDRVGPGARAQDLPPSYQEQLRSYSQLRDQVEALRPKARTREAAEAGPSPGGEGEHSYKGRLPGKGTGSDINLASGIRDSEYLNRDARGGYIPAPAFILYGHELIHALHNKRGTDRSQVDADAYRQRAELRDWDDQEEHATIASRDEISENWLRHEHGLALRGSHFGIAREDTDLA